jgi:hypothetical protein
LQRKELVMHEQLSGAGADYAAAAEISAELRALHAEVADVEAEWLSAAEDLENG